MYYQLKIMSYEEVNDTFTIAEKHDFDAQLVERVIPATVFGDLSEKYQDVTSINPFNNPFEFAIVSIYEMLDSETDLPFDLVGHMHEIEIAD